MTITDHNLTDNQVKILETIRQWHLLTTTQLNQLVNPHTTTRNTGIALSRLRKHHLVDRQCQQFGHAYWSLTDEALRQLGHPTKRSAKRIRVSSTQFRHHKAVTEIGIHLHQQATQNGHKLDDWQLEHPHPYTNKRYLAADAIFTYDTDQESYIGIIELDRGTEGLRTLRDKITAYQQWAEYQPTTNHKRQQHQWKQQYPGTTPPALTFVFDCPKPERRIEKLTEWVNQIETPRTIQVLAIPKQTLLNSDPFKPNATDLSTTKPAPLLLTRNHHS